MNRVISFFKREKIIEFVSERSDNERSYDDLVWDVRQKRKLNSKLFKLIRKLRNTLKIVVGCVCLGLLTTVLIWGRNNSEVKTFNQHYNYYKDRYMSSSGLGMISSSDFDDVMEFINEYKIVVEPKMLMALSAIEKRKFPDALRILTVIDSPRARWLEALCLMRAGDKKEARAAFEEIVRQDNLFAAEAKEILKKHYSKN